MDLINFLIGPPFSLAIIKKNKKLPTYLCDSHEIIMIRDCGVLIRLSSNRRVK